VTVNVAAESDMHHNDKAAAKMLRTGFGTGRDDITTQNRSSNT
jgi:hypothetical protein